MKFMKFFDENLSVEKTAHSNDSKYQYNNNKNNNDNNNNDRNENFKEELNKNNFIKEVKELAKKYNIKIEIIDDGKKIEIKEEPKQTFKFDTNTMMKQAQAKLNALQNRVEQKSDLISARKAYKNY